MAGQRGLEPGQTRVVAMSENTHRQQQAKTLRVARKMHRTTGICLFVFFFFISVTGLLLGWKKHSQGYLLAKTSAGVSSDLSTWLPMDSLHNIAVKLLRDSVSAQLSPELDRIDIRPEKGVVKFVFSEHYWGLQLDGTTGKLLQMERRRADFIEKVHDGSIVDQYLGLKNGTFKLFYTSIMGLALLLFTITGFWLWYGPKRMRKA